MKAFFFCVASCFSIITVHAQDKMVQLKQEHTIYAPKGYYISEVVDSRKGSGAIGTVTENGASKNLILQNGAAAAIKSFIDHNVSQNQTGQAVVLHIDKIDATGRTTGGNSQIEVATALSFYIGDKLVTEYSGKGHAQTDAPAVDYVEALIRKTIDNDLKAFGDWWAQNKGQIATSDAVKINVSVAKITNQPNAIVYSLERPLSIADFMGPPPSGGDELAATSSGKTMGITGDVKDGQLVVNVTITPVFSKSESWFKEEGKNARVLAHEQAHFDITAIKVCELAKTIRSTSFSKENYEKIIEALSDQNVKDINEEQAAYDSETNHGIIEDKQVEWQNRLKQKVKEVGCY